MQLSRCPAGVRPPETAGTLGAGYCEFLSVSDRGGMPRRLSSRSEELCSTPIGTYACLPRKEVIQPHLPVRLPCYDFTPLTNHTFDTSLPCGVGPAASGAIDSGGVTGGVYKARERIHRGMLIRDY